MNISKEFCFCTLAVGDSYCAHAQMLAQDIQTHMPGTQLCVLTDQPEKFKEFTHVLAFKHHIQSVQGFHDKRFVLEKALSLFESCMFLDSDVRVLGPIIGEMNWAPGITARAGTNLIKHMGNTRDPKKLEVIKAAAQKLDIDLKQVQWFHEFMFVMKRQNGLEKEFFQLWQTISYFFEVRGIYRGEGYSMGLAAAHIGMKIDFFQGDKFQFFKDKIERVKIKKGRSDLQEKKIYFDTHQNIEHASRPRHKKIAKKLINPIVFYYRLLRLRIFMEKDMGFQQIFR